MCKDNPNRQNSSSFYWDCSPAISVHFHYQFQLQESGEASSDTPNYKWLPHCSHWRGLEAGIADKTLLTEPWWAEIVGTACQEWGRAQEKPALAGCSPSRELMPGYSREGNSNGSSSVPAQLLDRGQSMARERQCPGQGVGELPVQLGRAAGSTQPHLQQHWKASHPLGFPQGRGSICSPKPLSKLLSLSVLVLTCLSDQV